MNGDPGIEPAPEGQGWREIAVSSGWLLAHCGLPDDDRITLIRQGQGGGVAVYMPAHAAPRSPDVAIPDRGGDRPVSLGCHRAHLGIDEGGVLGAGVDRLR